MPNNIASSAQVYDASIQPLPNEYTDFCSTLFNLMHGDRVIDVGCGTGLLTFPLLRYSSNIEALDRSREMINVAKSKDINQKIRWFEASAEDFDFGNKRYKLIIGFESFHEFISDMLIKNMSRALIPGGYLAIGWVKYQWEDIFSSIIVDTFASRDFTWGDWNYYTCPTFPNLVDQHSEGLCPVMHDHIDVKITSTVNQIARYLVSIDKTSTLSIDVRAELLFELESKFRRLLSSDRVEGTATYNICYTKRR